MPAILADSITATTLPGAATPGTYTYSAPLSESSKATYGTDGSLSLFQETLVEFTQPIISGFTFYAGSGGTAAYSTDGSLMFQGVGTGDIELNRGTLDFSIETMTPVPLPPSFLLFASGLLLLALRRSRSNSAVSSVHVTSVVDGENRDRSNLIDRRPVGQKSQRTAAAARALRVSQCTPLMSLHLVFKGLAASVEPGFA
jgi:hypothetical protein